MFTDVYSLCDELARPVACGWLSERNAKIQLLTACLSKWNTADDNTRKASDPFAAHKFACWLLAEKVRQLSSQREVAIYRLEQLVWAMVRRGERRVDIYAAAQAKAAEDRWLTRNQVGDIITETYEAARRWQRQNRGKRP